MKKIVSVLGFLSLSLACLVSCSGRNDKKDDGKDALTLARWDIEQINTARKKKTPIFNAVKDATGIDINVLSVSHASYQEKLNLLFASEELPDVFVSSAWDTPSTFKKWIKDDAVVDYTKYVTSENYPNIYKRLQKYSLLKQTISYFNGGMYALPIETLPLHCFYVRTDWIENLNNKLGDILLKEGIIQNISQYNDNKSAYDSYKFGIPETLPEFYRLTYAFTYYDPDNNGKNDTKGYSCCTDNMWYNNWIFEAMSSSDKHDSAYWGYVEDGNDKLVSSWVTEGNKKSIYFLNKLYTENILDHDFVRLTEDECRTSFVQGSIGIYMENFYYNDMLRSFSETYNKSLEEAKTMFTCCIPPQGQSGVRGMRVDPGFWDGLSISNKLSERKINLALKLIDYLCSDTAKDLFTWGIEGVHYEVVNDQRISLMGKDSNGFNYTLETFDNGFPLCTFTNWDYLYNSPYESNHEFISSIFDQMIEVGKHDPVSVLQPETYVEYDLSISQNSKEAFVDFIRGSSYYNSKAKSGMKLSNTDWDDLTGSSSLYTSSMNTDWNYFCDKFRTKWHGNEIMQAMNNLYPTYKQIYIDFFKTLYK